ncbi:subclass B1 metallo-beta-lactamase [bacterium SCSIO 12741]|nr:subclass B1 metallo-beta-lactamase [bacterium SCSIO 12741]
MKYPFIALVASLLLFASCSNSEPEASAPVLPEPLPNSFQSDYLIIEPLSENCWLHTSYIDLENIGPFPCNGLIYIHEEEALVFDTPLDDSAAVQLIRWVETARKAQIKHVVATHHHEDCLGSLDVFHQAGIPSYGHVKCLALAEKDSATPPQLGIGKQHFLVIGGDSVEIRFPGEGHSIDNLVGWVPSQKVLFGGCLVKSDEASKGYLGDANLDTWSNTIKWVKKEFPEAEIVVPGHGEPGGPKLLDYTASLFQQDTLSLDDRWGPEATSDRTVMDFGTFTVKLEGKFEKAPYTFKDTVELWEDVGWYITSRRLWAESNDPNDRFEFRALVRHSLIEQYQYIPGDYPSTKEYYAWEKNRVKWEGFSDYAFMKDSLPGVWVIPYINCIPYKGRDHGPFSLALKEQKNLRDTFVHYSDEGGMNTSTFVYKEKPCYYQIPYSILKVTRIQGDIREHKYIRVVHSYGC